MLRSGDAELSDPANCATDKRLGIGNARFKPRNGAFFGVAHRFELVDDELLDGLFPRKAHQLLFAVNDQVGHFGNAVDALHDGVFAATALDVLYFYLKNLCHVEILLSGRQGNVRAA